MSWQDVPCKIWTGAKTKAGYGIIHRNYKTWSVHRYTWVQAHGDIPREIDVCHHCDVRDCYELAHLFIGTRKQNMADCKVKGRAPIRSRHGQSKITPKIAKEIISIYAKGGITQSALAKQFGVAQVQISNVVLGKHWTTRRRVVLKRPAASKIVTAKGQ